MRFVELKWAEQLDMQVLHHARDRLVAERTALINQLRAVLMERGITVPQGRRKLEQALSSMLEGCETALSPRVRALINDMRKEWCALDHRICAFDNEFAARAREDERARPSVTGRVLRAVAISRLGFVPRQATTGGKPRLKGISKRGNAYLRKLLIHGSRAALFRSPGVRLRLAVGYAAY
jgi:transposase